MSSLVDLLRGRTGETTRETMRSPAYSFLTADGLACWSYSDLDRRARAIAAVLGQRCDAGDRALLLMPPGLDYVAAFFGCLYAGVIAVPAYPPATGKAARGLPRIEAICADARPTVALTVSAMLAQGEQISATSPVLAKLTWIACDDLAAGTEDGWREHGPSPDDLAFLQYTSGSTATPKGVMVSHGNLMRNGADIQRFFHLTPDSKAVIWLPPYHDMGLIGGILQPLYTGYPVILMAPNDFIQRPFTWLRAVSEHGATVSGGPSFAYDLCVRRITPEQVAQLDLGSWTVAFNGAEPVRADVLDRFTATFAPAGFARRSFFPCYGLAEGTLIVSGGRPLDEPIVRPADTATPGALPLVGCGQASPDQRLLIVDPHTHEVRPGGQEGEVWVGGPSVAQGYWGREEETEQTFRARLAGSGDGPFLRTGDLGLIEGDQLYITGRIKDLLILRGVNHYPQDLEHTAAEAHQALSPNGGAAFTVPLDGEERLVIAHEVSPRQTDDELHEVIEAIRAAIGERHELSPHAVVLLRTGGLARTSSGKVQRQAVRRAYLAGELAVRAVRVYDTAESGARLDIGILRSGDAAARTAHLTEFVTLYVSARTGIAPSDVDLDRTGSANGLDSLALVELQHALELSLAVAVDPAALHLHSLSDLIALIEPAAPDRPATPTVKRDSQRLGYGQRAMWFLDQLTGADTAYNLTAAVRLDREIDVDAARRALQRIGERHCMVRASFSHGDSGPMQRIGAGGVELIHEELTDWSRESLDERLREVAHTRLSLADGPLTRAWLWTGAGQRPILVVLAHHIVSDFWSLVLLLKEFATLYREAVTGVPAGLAPPADYRDFVTGQDSYLDSAAGHAAARYWHQQLGGELPLLSLPTDRLRPAVQSYRGATRTFRLDAEVMAQLKELAAACGVTLYTLLLSAFQVFLHRYSGQPEIVVGSPTSGRTRAAFANTVGYFVNPVAVRGRFDGNPTFRSFLAATDRLVREALAHQAYPFALLAEQLQPVRDPGRSPVFQTMFIYQQAPMGAPAELGLLAVGQPGARFEIAGLGFESVPVPQQTAQFDLTLAIAEGERFAGSWQYNADLFDETTAEAMIANFQALLSGIAAAPDEPVDRLPMLDAATRHRILRSWNETSVAYPQNLCVHKAFETMVAAAADSVAVVHRDEQITYRELDTRADTIARHLMAHGVGSQSRVGICADRSIAMVAGLLGILKAGGCYVPLDPAYPADRLTLMIEDAGIAALVTEAGVAGVLPPLTVPVLDLEQVPAAPQISPPDVHSGQPAYVLYTSGSTGKPKGVVVSHQNVINFFAGMDERVGCGPRDTMLAVTSISFDISVLELLWTLSRGARVVLAGPQDLSRGRAARARKPMDFSLFYFASADTADSADKYRLVLDGARFADTHGFSAVWTPERHFHEFGGLYPNPSVLSAAIAAITERVGIRAGSVVLPLHSPLRVAEEWAVVDNLSHGRVGIAFASGWHANDFAFFPDRFADRKRHMDEGIEAVRKLWAGGGITVTGGAGNEIDVRVFPAPIQPDLPIWVTAAGAPQTFTKAGQMGANVLTHLLGQSVEQVAANISAYRAARQAAGFDPQTGVVTLMLHTYLGQSVAEVRDLVRVPFTQYLRSSVGLIDNLIKSMKLPLDLATMTEEDMAALLDFAFERYFETSALFGTVESVQPLVQRLGTLGVDEIACLIDFGLPGDTALEGLPKLARLRQLSSASDEATDSWAIDKLIAAHRPTLMQSTPSMMRMLTLDPAAMKGLTSLRALLLGGEAMPPALAAELLEMLPAKLINMYGPTETTIWSATHEVSSAQGAIPIGRPIANTQMYILNDMLEPAPPGAAGDLYIGGDGVAWGYWRRPGQTASSFIPDLYGGRRGGRLYRTGDVARYRPDGTIEFLGRDDRQVKVRGFRIEPGDIEAALTRQEGVKEAVVVAREDTPGDVRLVAYVVAAPGAQPSADDLIRAMLTQLPSYMAPSAVMLLPEFPLTANGKVDTRALPAPGGGKRAAPVPPSTELENRIAAIWREALGLETVGVYDNFFDLGGHSLLMAQVHARLQAMAGIQLPLIRLLEYPTISALADFLGKETDAAGASDALQASQDRARLQRSRRRTSPEGAGR
ncbi:MAG TPA: MupA/Atu3671 family FMN-dependent luciferase-like monooxygenase [Candidatus Limnocylindrales bacterium]|nr:MupA/Atu3671 family FMN-dependent luciferase-like monooxygenase [Candidatus Limnocylindrales bacterium]